MFKGNGEANRLRILDAMRDVHAATGFWPSVRELCGATGLRSTSTVGQHLRALERAGLVVQKGRGAPYALAESRHPAEEVVRRIRALPSLSLVTAAVVDHYYVAVDFSRQGVELVAFVRTDFDRALEGATG